MKSCRGFTCLFLALALSACDASPPKPQSIGGLSCFTVLPDKKAPRSCDDLCGEQSAVCTGLTSPLNPPPTCEDNSVNNAFSVCRCCKVTP